MRKIFLAFSLTIFISGCASALSDPLDPFENTNRIMYGLNKVIDGTFIRPAAWVYNKVSPPPVKHVAGNFLSNLTLVSTVANDILQLRISQAIKDSFRFGINSTFGVLGLFDVAQFFGLKPHHTSLGDTFYQWGWTQSMFVVLPLFGPSTMRDAFGKVDGYVLSPTNLLYDVIHNDIFNYWVFGIGTLHARSELIDKESMLFAGAVDEYLVVKSAYLQYRQNSLEKNIGLKPVPAVTVNTTESDNFLGEPPE